MPEQPQWSERTLDMPPQDPWADNPTTRTAPADAPTSITPASGAPAADAPTSAGPVSPAADKSPFSQGRARVTQRTEQFRAEHEPTGTGWPVDGGEPRPQRSLGWHISRLRRGGEWSGAAVLFSFVCWGIWALSQDGDLIGPLITFVVSVIVAVGVFSLARLVGRLVLEQRMGRVRQTARGAHMVAGVFLTVVGFAYLRQTGWVMDAVEWITGLFAA